MYGKEWIDWLEMKEADIAWLVAEGVRLGKIEASRDDGYPFGRTTSWYVTNGRQAPDNS